jgi:hypothetical protein
MPEQHTVVITVEASGEVTPAKQAPVVEAAEEKEASDG